MVNQVESRVESRLESPFRAYINHLIEIKDRALSCGEVQVVYFHADDLSSIGAHLLEVLFAEHSEIPQGLVSIFHQKQFFDFGLSVIQGLFKNCPVQVSYVLSVKRHVQVWYANENVKTLVL